MKATKIGLLFSLMYIKKMNLLQHSLKHFALLFGLLLPVSTQISNIPLILFYIVVAMMFFLKKTTFQRNNTILVFYSVLILFLPCVISLFFADDLNSVWKATGRRITFLITPLVFLFLDIENIQKVKLHALKGLLVGSTLTALFLIVKNLLFYYATRPIFSIDNEVFNFYHTGFQFTSIIDIHPSYLGIYYFLALAFLLFQNPIKNRAVKISCFIILTLAIIFLASRIVLFLLALVLLIYIWQYIKLHTKSVLRRAFVFAISIILLTIGVLGLFKNTYLSERVTSEAAWELTYNVNENINERNKGDSRLARWDAAVDLILDKPILGYGVGNEKDLLYEAYKEKGLFIAAQKRYDAHNQYLSYGIELGVLGLLILSFFLISNLFYSVKSKDFLSVVFFIGIGSIAFIENFFNNNAGITFIAFFSTIFLFSNSYHLNKG